MNAAAAGTLTFMVGAETEQVFLQAESLLKGWFKYYKIKAISDKE